MVGLYNYKNIYDLDIIIVVQKIMILFTVIN